ncbi:thymidine kinase [Infectious spleen and kidney necrosis virus]|nr:thymidine kinase [Infectious spleen and kidney necrosis virus]
MWRTQKNIPQVCAYDKMAPVYTVFGHVGVGKSSLLRSLANTGINVVLEPTDTWEPFFQLYYKDPVRWAAAFQMTVIRSYSHIYSANKDNPLPTVVERSPQCCRAFVAWLYATGQLDTVSHDTINTYIAAVPWFSNVTQVYLRCSPTVAAARALARPNELNPCAPDYMAFLHTQWEARVTPDTIIIDAEQDMDTVRRQFIDLLHI